MNTYYITHLVNGYKNIVRCYQGYTKRENIKKYRKEFNLKHKKIDLVVSKNFIS